MIEGEQRNSQEQLPPARPRREIIDELDAIQEELTQMSQDMGVISNQTEEKPDFDRTRESVELLKKQNELIAKRKTLLKELQRLPK